MSLVSSSTLRSYIDIRSSVTKLISKSEDIASAEERALAGYRGGLRDFTSEAEIEQSAKADRDALCVEADSLIADTRRRVDSYLEDAFMLRPEVASQLPPLLSAGLSDADLRSLARQHSDYTSLRLISGVEGSTFSKQLEQRLDAYRDGVDAEIARALKLAKSAIVNTPKPDSLFNSRNCWGGGVPIDVSLENIDALNDGFDAWLDNPNGAETPSGGLLGMVIANA